MAPNEAQETCYILLKFANGELGMGTLDFIKKPILHVGLFSRGTQVQDLIRDETEIAVVWPKDQQSSFQIPVVDTSTFRKWPLRAATLLACSDKKRDIIQRRNDMAAQMKSILNSQELREAMTVSEDENDNEDDNEDDSSEEDENRNDRPTDSNNAFPKESPLPSPKSFATCSRPNISTSVNKSVTPSRFDSSSPGGNGVLLKNNAVFSQLSNISSSPPSTPLHSRINNERHQYGTPVTGKRTIGQENELLRSKVAKLEETIASKEDQLKTQEEEMQRMEEELAAAKSNMLDNPSVLSHNLKEGLQLLQSIISTAGEQSSPLQDRTRNTALTASGVQKVKLSRTCATLINPNALKNAVSYGNGGKKTTDMNAMINVIMEDLWDRKFMSEHSLSGNKAKNDKSDKPAKPALPTDSVQAIINYVTEFWRKKYTITLEAKHIRSAISTKLSTENSAFKKRSSIVASATARNNLTADDDGQPGAAGGADENEDADEIST